MVRNVILLSSFKSFIWALQLESLQTEIFLNTFHIKLTDRNAIKRVFESLLPVYLIRVLKTLQFSFVPKTVPGKGVVVEKSRKNYEAGWVWDLDTGWISLGGEVDGPTGTRGRQLGTWTNGPQVSHLPSGAGGANPAWGSSRECLWYTQVVYYLNDWHI